MRLTDAGAKNSSSSPSVRSKAKLPIKAVYGGSVGRGRSSRGGPRSARGGYREGAEAEGRTDHARSRLSWSDRGRVKDHPSQNRQTWLPLCRNGLSDRTHCQQTRCSRAVGRLSISSAHDPRAMYAGADVIYACRPGGHMKTNRYLPRTHSGSSSVLFSALHGEAMRQSSGETTGEGDAPMLCVISRCETCFLNGVRRR